MFFLPAFRRLPAFAVWFLTALASLAAEPECPKIPAPEWIAEHPIPPAGTEPEGQIPDGSWLLLIDEQRHAGLDTFYGHYARKFLSPTGVQEHSRISLTFDPAYEKIALHTLRIHRDGKVIDRLAEQPVQILQREAQMEQHLYDGRKTAALVLDDIRVGDVLEYAYSLRGSNPIFGGRFSDFLSTTFSFPVREFRQRLLWPGGRELQILEHGKKVTHTETRTGDLIDHRWSADDLPTLRGESGTPSWSTAGGWIQLSEYPSWKAVVDWALAQYTPAAEFPAALEPVIERLRALPSGEAQILGALEFAQDDLRYLALALGAHSHQPYPIATVLARGFGDCKDKARLLCAILGELGYTAHPALVETDFRQSIGEWLPTPLAFDHVVVCLEWDGRTYWLDPTSSLQRGSLAERYFPAYGKALVVKPGNDALSDVTPSGFDANSTRIHEDFEITAFQTPVKFTVETVYRGRDADSMRRSLAETSRDEIRTNYSNYYARLFPTTEIEDTPSFKDDTDRNQVTSEERYTIKELWQPLTGDDSRLYAEFYPATLADYLGAPATSLRTMPLHVGFPRKIEQVATIHLPDDSTFAPEKTRVDDPAFRFAFDVSQKGRLLTLRYAYESLRDHVPVDALPAYLAHLKQARDTLSYSIDIPKDLHAGPAPVAIKDDLNWLLLAVALMTFLGSIVAAILLYRWRPQWPPGVPDPRLRGLGGWLVLTAIALILQPFLQAALLVQVHPHFLLTNWNALTTPGGAQYHPLWAPTILYSVIIAIAIVVFDILLLVLFFQKRRTFPVLMIVHLSVMLLASILDLAAVSAIEGNASYKSLVQSLIRAAIWIPYFCVSVRVRTTFIR